MTDGNRSSKLFLMKRRWNVVRYVSHKPHWVPADLPIDAQGNTRPGFICTHQLENGMGPCGANVFTEEDEVGLHGCLVWHGRRRKMKTDFKGWGKKSD